MYNNLSEIKYIHMLGINGISMSGLAEILLSRGIRVSGSDLTASDRTERLKELGAVIYSGNSADNIKAGDPPDLLVYTAAAAPDNPERLRAAALGIPCADRARLLGDIMAGHKRSIGVTGTHGKTTTASMAAAILLADGLDPTINIGGEFDLIGGNSRIGGGDIFLAEACEYTDTFLKLRPSIAVITNIEYDHSDYFKDIEQLRASFLKYAGQAGSAVVANADDPNTGIIRERWFNGGESTSCVCGEGAAECNAAGHGEKRWITFGLKSGEADFYAYDIRNTDAGGSEFFIAAKEYAREARIRLNAPGLYNVYNALAAAAAAIIAGCSFEAAAEGLEAFGGLKKRFEYKGSINGFDIFDDYAHHPTAVRNALGAARKRAGGGRVFCVFQPHTYTRTRTFLAEFAEALAAADHVLLADIFPAREADPGDISSALLCDEVNRRGGNAAYFPSGNAPGYAAGFAAIADRILSAAKPGDLVLTMGAGRASDVADILIK